MTDKLTSARIAEFVEEVFHQNVDTYDVRLFDFARLVEAEVHKQIKAKSVQEVRTWTHFCNKAPDGPQNWTTWLDTCPKCGRTRKDN